jgi:hypothetical protein
MGFNYGYEKKKFDSRWKRLEVEYCDAGMSEDTPAPSVESSAMGTLNTSLSFRAVLASAKRLWVTSNNVPVSPLG